ncbi:MAG: hypothetical protein WBA43_13525 [Elainellaceae cyanobacterium]|nr:hypothetical protein [Synechococcales cyanobacterium K32_A2020_035]
MHAVPLAHVPPLFCKDWGLFAGDRSPIPKVYRSLTCILNPFVGQVEGR